MFSSIVSNIAKVTSSLSTTATSDFPFTIGEEINEWRLAKDCGTLYRLLEGKRNAEIKSNYDLDVITT